MSTTIPIGDRELDNTIFELLEPADLHNTTSASSASQSNHSPAEHQGPALVNLTATRVSSNAPQDFEETPSNGAVPLNESLSDSDPFRIKNDPTGLYSEALSEELGVSHTPAKDHNTLRISGLELDSNNRDTSLSRQSLYRRSHHPSTSGYDDREDQGDSRHSQASNSFLRAHNNNLFGAKPVNRQLFEDQYEGVDNEIEPTATQQSRGLQMSVGTSYTRGRGEMAPPPLPGSASSVRLSSGNQSRDSGRLSSPSTTEEQNTIDDEYSDDQSELFVQQQAPRVGRGGGGSNRKHGSNNTRESGSGDRVRRVADRTPISLRAGKRQFSLADFGQLDEDDVEPQAKTPRYSSSHISARQTVLSKPHNADAYSRFLAERSERPTTPPFQRPSHKQRLRFQDPEEDDEDDDGMDEQMEVEFSLDHRRFQPPRRPEFNNFGEALRDSRYAGGVENVNVNQDPPMLDQADVSNAALAKRNLKRGKKGTVCARGYGANDPENIKIVNLRESENMSFEQIAKVLNKNRIDNGRNPTLSTTGVTSRYNRTAPLLFAAQGEEFVPLSQRRRGEDHRRPAFNMAWTDELDSLLVSLTKKVEKDKWVRVAELFSEATGKQMTPTAVAYRYKAL